jgi:hypothetical protein
MRSLPGLSVLLFFLMPASLDAQTLRISNDFFPASMEFKEIKAIRAEREIKDPAALAKLEQGPILIEAGLVHFAERSYVLENSGILVISIFSFPDVRNSYSVLSLLAKASIQVGPPGDFFVSDGSSLWCTAGSHYVHIGSGEAGDLPRRVAVSITNRIATPTLKRPALVRHIPEQGCDSASARYFLGPRALETFGLPVAGMPLPMPAEVEIAQARCTIQNQSAIFTLLSFPTIQIAEEYFNTSPIYAGSARGKSKLYTRQTGPLVAILDGNFEPDLADKTLGSLQFKYAIKWIYDGSQSNRMIWGVPVRILGTVVRSILFTALLCAASIVAGILLAFARIYARRRWPRLEEYNSYIRLKIDEN